MKQEKLKICVLGSTYPRFHEDPQVPWLRETVGRLSERGHEVTVAASAFAGSRNHAIDGINVLRYRYAPARFEKLTHDEGAPSKVGNPLIKLLAITYIISGIICMLFWCAKYRFDVINVHWPFPHGLFTILPKMLFGTKIVVTAHGAGMAMARKNKVLKLALRCSILAADKVQSNSSHTASELKSLTGRSSEIIPYGSTVESSVGVVPFTSEGKIKILFSGRHIERKGVPHLIRALPSVLEKVDVELLITGQGDRTFEWKCLARDLGLEDSVHFLGFVSNEELAHCYRTCDIYCLPAIFDSNDDTEGLGVVLIEALMHARPVIAGNVGGIIDVIKNEQTGLLVEEKSHQELSDAVLRLIENPEYARELGEAGKRFVIEFFNWDRVISQYEQMLVNAVCQSDGVSASSEMVGASL